MADVNPVSERGGNILTKVVTWDPLTQTNSTGAAYELNNVDSVTFQVTGTAGGADVDIVGGNIAASISSPIVDPAGAPIAGLGVNDFAAVGPIPRFIRPILGGSPSGTTDLTVTAYIQKKR